MYACTDTARIPSTFFFRIPVLFVASNGADGRAHDAAKVEALFSCCSMCAQR